MGSQPNYLLKGCFQVVDNLYCYCCLYCVQLWLINVNLTFMQASAVVVIAVVAVIVIVVKFLKALLLEQGLTVC